jgi:carotenoid cleavage dioxygenase-like enzyme
MTESAEYNTHDPETLATHEPLDLTQIGQLTTAHPHFDYDTNEFINLCVKLGPTSHYRFFAKGCTTGEPRVFAEYQTRLPSYVHSFGLTGNYVILILSPLKVNPLKLRFGNRPYYDCYHWHDRHSTKIVVLSRQDGHVVKEVEIEKAFVFHFVNCFEEDNQLVVDYCGYNNAERINRLYLDDLKKRGPGPLSIRATLKRTRLNLDTNEVNTTDSGIIFEMPTINYRYYNTYEYQYVYGLSNHAGTQQIENALVKVDMSDFSTTEWYEPNMYPQEGIFVPNPDSLSEDDGVILTIVLDTEKEDSFLLVLNASDLTELARAYIGHIVPFGFHGAFY